MEFFAGANTRFGFKSIFDEIFKDIERIYILKGSSGCGKSTFMKRVAEKARSFGIDVDIIRCSADSDSLDGVIIKDLKIAVADGTAPHVMDVKYPCVRESIINFGEFWDESKLIPRRAEIMGLTDLKGCHYKNAYRALAAAGNIDELSRTLIASNVNRKKLDDFAFKLCEKLFSCRGNCKSIFTTAFTGQGECLLKSFDEVKVIYAINGIAKDFLLDAIRLIAAEAGVEFTLALNTLDPSVASSIYFPESETLVTALSQPPCKGGGKKHSLSTARFLDKGGISAIKNRLNGLEQLKKELLSEAAAELASAKEVHNEIEAIYIPAMDFDRLDSYTQFFIKKIFWE